MIGKYNASTLKTDFDQPNEHRRVQSILQDLYDRSVQGEAMSESEKAFICGFIKTAEGQHLPDFNEADICSSFHFKHLFYIYYHDLTGGSQYIKPYGLELRVIPISEVAEELEELKSAAADWEAVLTNTATADRLVIAAIKEFNFELKTLQQASPEYQSKFMFGGRNKYSYDLMATVLVNRFIYLTTKEIIEDIETNDLILVLNGKQILITEHSIFHIVNRHFGAVMKRYKSKKSFHKENFHPRLLNNQLRKIFDKIEASGGLKAASLKEIYFKYSEETYKIYTNDSSNQKDDIHLSTFFPLTDPDQLLIIIENFDLVQIDGQVSIYQPKS